MREQSVVTLRCKLRVERRKVRDLEKRIAALRSDLRFQSDALARSSQIIAALDTDGHLWDALMSGKFGSRGKP